MENEAKPPSTKVATDVFGIGHLAQYVAAPILAGIGKLSAPALNRLASKEQLKNFSDWDDELAARGYEGRKAELTLSERAEIRITGEQVSQQQNRENIARATIEQAEAEFDTAAASPPTVDPDWLGQFWRLAENISNDDVQQFWATILARTCLGTGTVGARTLTFLSTLSADEARALERASQYYLRIEVEPGNFQHAILQELVEYGPGFPAGVRDDLEKNGAEIRKCIGDIKQTLFGALGVFVEDGFAFSVNKRNPEPSFSFQLGGQPFEATAERDLYTDKGLFRVGGRTQVSPLGQEIFQFLRPQPDEEYISLVTAAMKMKGVRLEKLKSQR